ncbi:MAG: hypothetical protein ACW99G_00515 [Candidatus Thorarchaeota archaeon]|jgi:hypothetical protein
MEETVVVVIEDLGAAAYLLMHGYKFADKEGKRIMFEVEKSGVAELKNRKNEYLTSQFHHFDSCLMSLKKM